MTLKNKKIYFTSMISNVFEEIVALGIHKTYPILCSLHLHKSGDIMLMDKRIEIK